ncbi:MAG: FecR family protein [Phycisphaerales bacterium]|nr:FecR family protein [Phycisphaerales bacterium]
MIAHLSTPVRHLTALVLSALLSSPALAQDGPVTTDTPDAPVDPVQPGEEMTAQERLNELALRAAEAVAPLPEGEVKQLKTIVMGVEGKCQWRKKDAKAWTDAKVDQALSAGTQIRTGRKSKLVLRVGLNATVLVDSLARVTLPTVVQEGGKLKTMVQVKRGRADVKVGHVGLTNDFSVLTPSGALAVKGTEFAVAHSALKGTQIVSARTNTIRAIEVNYFGSKVTQYLSASSVSTQKTPNPATVAAFAANGPPPLMASAALDRQDAPSAAAQAVSGTDPVQGQTRQQVAAQHQAGEEDELPADYPLSLEGWEPYLVHQVPQDDLGHLAAAIYFDMKLQHLPPEVDPYMAPTRRVVSTFENNLFERTNWFDHQRDLQGYYNDDTGQLDVPWGAPLPDPAVSVLGGQYQAIIDYGDMVSQQQDGDQSQNSQHAKTVLSLINEFCEYNFTADAANVVKCREAFAHALNKELYNHYGPTQYGYQLSQLEDLVGPDGGCPDCP